MSDQSPKAVALLTLTADQRKKLVALARVKVRGTTLQVDDLLQGARARWLNPDSKAGDGGCCDAGPLRAGNLGVAFGVLALVLRRRRRA